MPKMTRRPARTTESLERELKDMERQLALMEREQARKDSYEHLLAYTRYTMPDPEDPDNVHKSLYNAQVFHTEVAKALEAVERGEIKQLIFCMPPRHGKTELATKRMAAWCSGRHPEWNIAVGSYSDGLAEDMGSDVRNILTSPAHAQVFPKYALRAGGKAKANIVTSSGGRLVFVGRGGPLTGRGAHLLLIDDLYKDHEEARSPTIRDIAWNWFTRTAMTRRMGRKLVIITMTRWHSDDIIGRLTDPENPYYNEKTAKEWKIINIPALAEENDLLGRKVGEPLWPEEFGTAYLESFRNLDPLAFSALYQQRPSAADGILFQRDNIQYYGPEDLPSDLRIYAASDHAVATTQRNDFTVLLVAGVDKQDNIYLLDCWWKRAPSDTVVEAMLNLGGRWRPLLWWAENGHISKSIGPFLRKRMRESRTFINIVEKTPVGDKTQRAQSIAAWVALGKVFFPRVSVWGEKGINELMAFPTGNHDDFADALAWLGLGLNNLIRPRVEKAAAKEPKFGTLAWLKKREAEDKRSRGRYDGAII